jgi:hypothetical protein
VVGRYVRVITFQHGHIFQMFDTTSLPAEAQAIITRHQIQDDERLHASRSRLNHLQELRQSRLHEVRARDRTAANNKYNKDPKEKQNKSATPRDAEAEYKRMLAAFDTRIERLDTQIAKIEAEAPAACLTAPRILSELDRFSSSILEEVQRPEIVLIDGERDIADALPRFRENVRLAKAVKRAAKNEPLPAVEVKKAARRQIHRLAAQGVPMVRQMFGGGNISWPRIQGPATVGANFNPQIDAAALLAFLFEDELSKKLDQLIESNVDLSGSLPLPQRAKHLATLTAAIDEAERIEAAAVEAIIAEGGDAFHRPDISVLAALSLRVA